MPEPPLHERTLTLGGHDYVQKYRYVHDPKTGKYRFELVESRPLHPVYRRPGPSPTPPYETYACTLLQFGLLATHLLNGTLTALEAVRLIGGQAVQVPPETLEELGIRVSFKKKQPNFEFLLWRSPPSSRPRRAPSARPRGRSSTGGAPPTS